MHTFVKKVHNFIIENNMFKKASPVIVGVSGGADSICLATVLNNLGYDVVVAHVNHNLRGCEAKRDENFVREFALINGMKFELFSADVEKIAKEQKISCEMAGRNIRYDFFNQLSQKYHTDFIAVAHNMNDNTETVLMNIIQGGALAGHKGIAPVNKKIKRPFLCVTREEIEDYLNKISISYVNDSTNFKDIYTRNFIRNQIVPLIKEINPNINETLAANSKIAFDENNYIDSVAEDVYSKICHKTDNGLTLDINSDNLHISIKRRVIKKALNNLIGDKKRISSSNIEDILNLKNEKIFKIANTLTIRNIYGKLWFVFNEQDVSFSYCVKVNSEIYVKEIDKTFKLSLTDKFEKNENTMNIDYDKINGEITIRSKESGDKFSPLGLNGTQSVKNYFVNKKIPYFLRNKIPIITCNGEIIGIFPDRIDKKYAITENTKKILTIKEI